MFSSAVKKVCKWKDQNIRIKDIQKWQHKYITSFAHPTMKDIEAVSKKLWWAQFHEYKKVPRISYSFYLVDHE